MKVLVANQPRILRECLTVALAARGEIEVIAGAANAAAILRAAQQHKPDCVVLSLEGPEANPRICRAVLSQNPRTLILAIGPRTLTIYWFELIVRHARKDCSLQTILDLLRTKLSNPDANNADRVPGQTHRKAVTTNAVHLAEPHPLA